MLSGPPSVMIRRQAFALLNIDGANTGTYLSAGGYYLSAGSLLSTIPQEIRLEDRDDGNGAVALFEGRSKNLLTKSEEFDHADWAYTATVTANTDVAPDGNQTADTLEDTSTSAVGIKQDVTLPSTGVYTASWFVKKDNDETRFPEFQHQTSATERAFVQLNTKTGATTFRVNEVSATATVEDIGDYWRLSVTGNYPSTSYATLVYPAVTTTFGSVENAATGSSVIWGAQLEQSPFPTSYIHTQNLLTQSENFAHSDWSGTATVTPNTDVAPDGTTTADTITDDDTGASEIAAQRTTGGLSVGPQYVLSWFVKQDNNETRFPEFLLDNDGNALRLQLNTKTGATTERSNTLNTSHSVQLSGGYWRVSVVFSITTTSFTHRVAPAMSTTFGTTEVAATGSIVLWGAQLIKGSSTKPYTKTIDTLQAERHADARTFLQAEVPSRIFSGKFKGTFYPYASSDDLPTDKEQWILSVDGNANGLRVRNTGTSVDLEYVRGSSVIASLSITYSRHQKISFTLDHGAGSLTVSGATTGDGTASGTSGSWTAGPLRVAGIYGTIELLGFETGGTFARNYEGYYLDVDTLKVAAIDVRRFEDRDDGHGPVFLAEGASTNLLTRSEEFDHADWDIGVSDLRPTITANAAVAPDGASTADLVDDTDGSNTEQLQQTLTLPDTTTTYVCSVFVKKGTSSVVRARLRPEGGGGASEIVEFDFTTETITSSTGHAEFVGNGWWRISVQESRTAGASTTGIINLIPTDGAAASTGSVYFWGAQLEESEFPTSYIKTVSATATRVADSLTFTAAEVPDQIENGLWSVDFYPYWSSDEQPNSINAASLWHFQSDTGNDLRCLVKNGQVLVREQGDDFTAFMTHSCTWSRHQKLTLTFDFVNETVEFKGFTTGNGTDSMSGVNWGTLSSMRFGNITAGGQPYYGRISNIRDPDTGEAFMRIEDLKNA